MSVPDLEVCASFAFANRLIAERFLEEAERLFSLLPALDNPAERMRTLALIQIARARAEMHVSIADLQERDLGLQCYCPPAGKPPQNDSGRSSKEHAIAS